MKKNFIKELLDTADKLNFINTPIPDSVEDAVFGIEAITEFYTRFCNASDKTLINELSREEFFKLKKLFEHHKIVLNRFIDIITDSILSKRISMGDLESLSKEQLLDIIKNNL